MVYKVLTETLSVRSSQFNSGRRSIEVTIGDESFYAELSLQAEHDGFGGQRASTLTVFPRPSIPLQIMFDMPSEPEYSSYGSDEDGKRDMLTRGLDNMSLQAVDWLTRFVAPVAPKDR